MSLEVPGYTYSFDGGKYVSDFEKMCCQEPTLWWLETVKDVLTIPYPIILDPIPTANDFGKYC
jgi:hypothetical protein